MGLGTRWEALQSWFSTQLNQAPNWFSLLAREPGFCREGEGEWWLNIDVCGIRPGFIPLRSKRKNPGNSSDFLSACIICQSCFKLVLLGITDWTATSAAYKMGSRATAYKRARRQRWWRVLTKRCSPFCTKPKHSYSQLRRGKMKRDLGIL